MVASFPAIPHAQLFYRTLDRNKTKALQEQKGDFEATTTNSSEAKYDLKWWVQNVPSMSKSVLLGSPELTTQSDALVGRIVKRLPDFIKNSYRQILGMRLQRLSLLLQRISLLQQFYFVTLSKLWALKSHVISL